MDIDKRGLLEAVLNGEEKYPHLLLRGGFPEVIVNEKMKVEKKSPPPPLNLKKKTENTNFPILKNMGELPYWSTRKKSH